MKNFKAILLFLVFLSTSIALNAQTYSLVEANLEITGTSTLHDWDMKSSHAEGYIQGVISKNKLESINGLKVNMRSRSLKSGKKIMDNLAYDILKTDEFKDVIFELSSAKKLDYHWELQGHLTVAGVKKPVTINVTESVMGNTITLMGTHTFKLTDFNIDPPVAMYGTIETGDDVSINFNLQFK